MSKVPCLKRLPKPHGKGANAEAGVVADTLLATQITSVLLSHKMRSAIHSDYYIFVLICRKIAARILPLSLFYAWRKFYEKHNIFRRGYRNSYTS